MNGVVGVGGWIGWNWLGFCFGLGRDDSRAVPRCWLDDAAVSSGARLDVNEANSEANRSEEDRRGTKTSPTNSDAAIPKHCDPETTTPPSCEACRELR